MHTILALLMVILGAELITLANVLTPLLRFLRIDLWARRAGVAMFTCLGTYLGWVGCLFWQDKLGGVNYAPTIIALRVCSVIATTLFLVAVLRCRRKLERLGHL